MKVIVTGSRFYAKRYPLRFILDGVYDEADGAGLIVVHGACPTGADYFADEWALERIAGPMWGASVVLQRFPPNIAKYGSPQAFHVRNKAMVDAGADLMLAFYHSGAKNAGTTSTVKLAKDAGIPVREYR